MKRILLGFVILLLSLSLQAQGQFKDVRQTYLWDVTLSMKGYNGAPNIYDKVVDVMVKDIQSITNERTEIVVIPFQDTKYCDVWRAFATEEGKADIIRHIRSYQNGNITNTNISAPLQYAIDEVFTTDKIDIMKLMTDGNDNVNPDKLLAILSHWCEIAKRKDAYGYYILLTGAAKNEELSGLLRDLCNFEEIDASQMLDGIADIRQLNNAWKEGVLINIRDEYNKPKRLEFNVYSGDGNIPAGFKVRFKTRSNPYVEIDEVAEMGDDNSLEIHPRFKKSQEELIDELPTEYVYSNIVLEYEPMPEMAENPKFAFTRIVDKECAVLLENKPVKTVQVTVGKDKPVKTWGKTNCYDPFLWKKYEPETLVQTVRFDFNDDAQKYVSRPLELGVFKKDGNGHLRPVPEEEMQLYVNGQPAKGNIIRANASDSELEVGMVVSPEAENKTHYWYLKPVDDAGLDRINGKEYYGRDDAMMEFKVKKRHVMNPLVKGIMWFLIAVLAALILWFIMLKHMFFPTFRVTRLQLAGPEPYLSQLKIKGYRQCILTATPQKQNWFDKVFRGEIKYEVNALWTAPVVFEPRDKTSVRIRPDKHTYTADTRFLKTNVDYVIVNETTKTKTMMRIS